MSEQPLQLGKSSLAYAKLVATPTSTAWSQVYNAGNLFACLELTTSDPQPDGSLHAVGKDLFNALEAEFFTLEEKNLSSIAEAITTSLKELPEGITANLSLAFFKEDILYLFISGAGKIIMKRGDKIGVLLEKTQEETGEVATASGYLNSKDIVMLQTHQFTQNITSGILAPVLELALPSDIAEALSPRLHEKEDGGQAAIIIVFHGPIQREPEPPAALDEENGAMVSPTQQAPEEFEEQDSSGENPNIFAKLALLLPSFPKQMKINTPDMHLTLRKKLFLGIFVVLVLLLIGGVFFTKSQEEGKVRHEKFQAIYTPAEKSYDEGKALKGLNDSLSQQDFLTAQQSIKGNLAQFPKGSPEEKQLAELLAKIEAELGGASAAPTTTSKATEISLDDDDFLKSVKANSGLAYGQNADSVFVLTSKAVTTVSKSDASKKAIIENDNDWKDGKAVAPYQGNVYVLDSTNGVLKFTAGSDGFGKSDYFKRDVDTSRATGMAIDGSIWIVSNDGSIQKYTKGSAESFKINGLTKPFSNPTGIVTDIAMDSIYILDRGNSRIVKLSKEGSFQAEYAAGVIVQAKTFTVSEKTKKLHILSQDKLWEIAL